MPTVSNVYEVPMILEDAGLADQIIDTLELTDQGKDMAQWRDMVERMKELNNPLPIAVVGKYVDLPDSYISVKESSVPVLW